MNSVKHEAAEAELTHSWQPLKCSDLKWKTEACLVPSNPNHPVTRLLQGVFLTVY